MSISTIYYPKKSLTYIKKYNELMELPYYTIGATPTQKTYYLGTIKLLLDELTPQTNKKELKQIKSELNQILGAQYFI